MVLSSKSIHTWKERLKEDYTVLMMLLICSLFHFVHLINQLCSEVFTLSAEHVMDTDIIDLVP